MRKLKKPTVELNLKCRVEEADKQLIELVDEDLVSELDQVDKDSVVKPKSEVSNLQTSRMESRKEKSMVLPGTQDMLKFSSSRPQELRRFIRQLEDLWKEAGITEDSEKKESIGKYADQDSEEEWSALKFSNP